MKYKKIRYNSISKLLTILCFENQQVTKRIMEDKNFQLTEVYDGTYLVSSVFLRKKSGLINYLEGDLVFDLNLDIICDYFEKQ